MLNKRQKTVGIKNNLNLKLILKVVKNDSKTLQKILAHLFYFFGVKSYQQHFKQDLDC